MRFHLFRMLCLIVLSGLIASNSSAQVLLASGVDDSQTHAWAIYENTSGEVLLVHLPPRDEYTASKYEIKPAQAGELHAIRPLLQLPRALASLDERVFLVFPEVSVSSGRIRRVFSGRAVPNFAGMQWGFAPVGRLDAEPAIEIEGDLIDFCATSQTIYALLQTSDSFKLLELGNSKWHPIDLPPQVAGQRAEWKLTAIGKHLVAVDTSRPDRVQLWQYDQELEQWSKLDWPGSDRVHPSAGILGGVRDLLLYSRDANGKLDLELWSADGLFVIAKGLDIPEDAAISRNESVNRVVAIAKVISSVNPEHESKGVEFTIKSDAPSDQPSIEIWEIDLDDGSVLYAGEPVVTVPVSAAEFRFLVGMMILIMLGVLVLVIMPESGDALEVPTGFALADPGRRMLATLLDVFVIAMVVGKIFDVQVIEIITLSVIVRTDTSWMVIPSMLVFGVVSMSILEWLLGVTPGKLLMGLRVVKAQSGPMQRIPLWAALVRNIIKWILPPVAAMALIDPEMLHRGDRATKSLVAIPIEPNLDDEPESSDTPGDHTDSAE